jgi:lipopolysaccharide export system permease protein
MRTLHRYLTRQVFASLLMTVAVFTFVLLLGNVLKEVLSLLVNQQATFATVVQAIGLLIPYVMVFALPMGLLTATLLTFGRFSADNELTAVRASGISLLSLISPILVLSALLSIICAFVNLHFAPYCRGAYKQLLTRTVSAHLDRLENLLPERTIIRELPPYLIYLGRSRNGELRGVQIYELAKGGTNAISQWTAPRGTVTFDRTNKIIRIVLFDAWYVAMEEGERRPVFWGQSPPVDIILREQPRKEPGISDLTFIELWEKRKQLKRQNISTTPLDVQMHWQVAFSFACIAFTLVGIPLGIRAHRRETSVGIAIALVLVVVYYSFLILGQSLDTDPKWQPWLIVWFPNFFFQTLGIIMLRRANRGV